MNHLSFRLTNDAHKKANVIVLKKDAFMYPTFGDPDIKEMVTKAKETLRENNAYNAQVEKDLGIVFNIEYIGLEKSKWDKENTPLVDHWKITGRNEFKIDFYTGIGHRLCFWGGRSANAVTALLVAPSAMDILYCIRCDDPHNEYFEDWCDNYGYDPDSRKAFAIYETCVRQTTMFKRNFPNVNLDEYAPLEDF